MVLRSTIDRHSELQGRINAALRRLDMVAYDALTREQESLFVFQPLMTHSVSEAKGLVPFRERVIADFANVEELGKRILTDLGATVQSLF